MAILVVCPGCRKRFSVNDQFAGKSGPCPKCKTVIRIPGKAEEVKIHGGEDFAHGGRSASGQLVLKPIAREETAFNTTVAVVIALAVVAACIVTYVGGHMGLFQESVIAKAVGLLLVTPPLVVGGYTFLRHGEDLDPYRGKTLYIRALICSTAYVALWGLFALLAPRLLTEEIWSWLLVAPILVIGSVAALGALDLDFGSAFLHYSFYVMVTLILRWLAHLPAIWDVSKPATPF